MLILGVFVFLFLFFFAAQGYGIQSPLLIYLLSLKTQKSANRIACFSSFTSLKHEGNEGTLASSSDRESRNYNVKMSFQ